MTPTERTLKYLKDAGYTVAITERWNPFAKIRQDLFGFVDVLAVKRDTTLAVQCTSASHVAARVSKIAALEAASKVREAGWTIQVWGWTKGKKGPPRIVDVS